MELKQKAIITLVVFLLSIIGYFVMEKLQHKKLEQGSIREFFHWGRRVCIVLVTLSGLALIVFADLVEDEEGDELFDTLKQRCEFVSLTLPQGGSMNNGGIGTFKCDGKQVDVSVSGTKYRDQHKNNR